MSVYRCLDGMAICPGCFPAMCPVLLAIGSLWPWTRKVGWMMDEWMHPFIFKPLFPGRGCGGNMPSKSVQCWLIKAKDCSLFWGILVLGHSQASWEILSLQNVQYLPSTTFSPPWPQHILTRRLTYIHLILIWRSRALFWDSFSLWLRLHLAILQQELFLATCTNSFSWSLPTAYDLRCRREYRLANNPWPIQWLDSDSLQQTSTVPTNLLFPLTVTYEQEPDVLKFLCWRADPPPNRVLWMILLHGALH